MRFKNLFLKLSSKEKGKKAENLAISYLVSKGFKIIEKNFRTSFGEIDIIARFKKTLIFAEVKTRHPSHLGLPQEAVDKRKQGQIAKTALHYLATHQLLKKPARFDVLSILVNPDGSKEVEWLKDAFPLPERYSY